MNGLMENTAMPPCQFDLYGTLDVNSWEVVDATESDIYDPVGNALGEVEGGIDVALEHGVELSL